MANDNPTDRGLPDPDSPATQDAKAERAVLVLVLDGHPDHLTMPEISRAINERPGDFSSEDAVERAIRELVGAGLLHLSGGLVLPTRAALYFERLEAR
jgi:hypothetical protein